MGLQVCHAHAAASVVWRTADGAAALSLKGSTMVVVVPSRADACEAGLTYWPTPDHPGRGLLRLPAKELGLNAQGALYRVAFDSGRLQYLGELPVAAEPDGPGRFRLVQ